MGGYSRINLAIKRKVFIVIERRADYSRYKPILQKMKADLFFDIYLVVTGICLLDIHGKDINYIKVPTHTYIAVPFLAKKIGIDLMWKKEDWKDYYYLTDSIIDAAVLWKKSSYIPGTFMCLSFQFQKHLSLGRGGMILTDNEHAARELKKMTYDGRLPDVPWREQNIETMGYHYYMTPETASLGLEKLPKAIETKPRDWELEDWPDLRDMELYK